MNVLEIKNLNISINQKHILSNVNLVVPQNSVLGLTGKSGSGKTLLGYAITNLQSKNINVTVDQLLFNSKSETPINLIKDYKKVRGKKIAYIFQEPSSALNPILTCGFQIEEITRSKERVIHLLNRMLFTDPMRIYDSYPHQLSGGEKQRVIIAIALALNPELIIADEPTSSLDSEAAEVVMNILSNLRYEMNFSLLFISHDYSLLKRYADITYAIDQGVLKSNTADLISPKQVKLTAPKQTNPAKLIIRNLEMSFGLKGIDLSIDLNDITGLVGPSGSGKSTLARLITGLVKNYRGSLEFLPDNPNVQLIQQDSSTTLNPKVKIGDSLNQIIRIKHSIQYTPESVLTFVNLNDEFLNRYPYQLSGGERQRVAIAKAIAASPTYLICDESLSALDYPIQLQIIELLFHLKNKLNMGILFISHDLNLVKLICNKIISINNGKIMGEMQLL
jgi:peptide/nickel transport system ATP-binding protein